MLVQVLIFNPADTHEADIIRNILMRAGKTIREMTNDSAIGQYREMEVQQGVLEALLRQQGS